MDKLYLGAKKDIYESVSDPYELLDLNCYEVETRCNLISLDPNKPDRKFIKKSYLSSDKVEVYFLAPENADYVYCPQNPRILVQKDRLFPAGQKRGTRGLHDRNGRYDHACDSCGFRTGLCRWRRNPLNSRDCTSRTRRAGWRNCRFVPADDSAELRKTAAGSSIY